MISKVLNDINGVAIYPIVTLLLFFSVFTFMLVKVILRKKTDDAVMAAMPLEDGVVSVQDAAKMAGLPDAALLSHTTKEFNRG